MAKKIIFGVVFLVLLYSLNAGICFVSVKSEIKNLKNFASYESADQLFPVIKRIKRNLVLLGPLIPVLRHNKNYAESLALLDSIGQTESLYQEFFARATKKKFLVLMQNNAELRPTGGFWGSYGILEVEDGKIISFKTADTYDIDRELIGKTSPPNEIKDIIGDEWRLWNANWSPDFKVSSEQGLLFLDQLKDKIQIDGIIAPDIELLLKLLKISGPVKVEGYNFTVSENNFVEKMIYEPNSFPAVSSKNREIIKAEDKNRALAQIAENALRSVASSQKQMELSKMVLESLESHDLLLFSKNQEAQGIIEKMNWGGRFPSGGNYIMAVDANFGSKLDFKVSKHMTVKKIKDDTYQATLVYKNNYELKEKNRQIYVNYRDYLRLYLPDDATLIDSTGMGSDVTLRKDQEIGASYAGYLLILEPGQETSVSITWKTATSKNNLTILKQPGQKMEIEQQL